MNKQLRKSCEEEIELEIKEKNKLIDDLTY